MNLPQLPQDKANHFVYGVGIALVAGLLAARIPALGSLLPLTPGQAGALAAALAAAAKEVYDRTSGKGTPDALDAVATAAGGVAVLAASALL